MTKEQEILLGSNTIFAIFPYSFEDAIRNHCSYVYSSEHIKSLSSMGKYWKFIKNTSFISVVNDNITINQSKGDKIVTISFIGYGVESMEVNTLINIQKVVMQKSLFRDYMVGYIEMDYNNPIDTIKLNFHNGIVESLQIKVNINLYQDPPIDYQKLYNEKSNVKHRLGENLVNIYFQYVREDIDLVEVELYAIFGRNEEQFIGKYTVDENLMFKTIQGLAYGTYSYKVIEYSKNEKIFETGKISFEISKPNHGRTAVNIV